jgi:hypothetical protein
MAEENESARIVKFNGKNFSLWHFQMELIFEARELFSMVTGTWRLNMCQFEEEEVTWRRKNSAARVLIGTCINGVQLEQLKQCGNASVLYMSSTAVRMYTCCNRSSLGAKCKRRTQYRSHIKDGEHDMTAERLGVPNS